MKTTRKPKDSRRVVAQLTDASGTDYGECEGPTGRLLVEELRRRITVLDDEARPVVTIIDVDGTEVRESAELEEIPLIVARHRQAAEARRIVAETLAALPCPVEDELSRARDANCALADELKRRAKEGASAERPPEPLSPPRGPYRVRIMARSI